MRTRRSVENFNSSKFIFLLCFLIILFACLFKKPTEEELSERQENYKKAVEANARQQLKEIMEK
jgi:hypothetical protein